MSTKADVDNLTPRIESAIRGGVSSLNALRDAVPLLVKYQEYLADYQKSLKRSGELAAELSRLCTEYATAHKSRVFDVSFSCSPIGVETGDIEIDGEIFHHVDGFNGYERDDGQKMTKDFYETLPSEWVKMQPKLDVKRIKEETEDDEDELEENGLCRKRVCTWSRKQVADPAEIRSA